ISSQLVKINSQVVVLNKATGPLKEYIVQFGDARHDDALSYLSASLVDSGSKKKTQLKVSKLASSGSEYASYKVEFGTDAVPAGSSAQLEIDATFTHLLEPYPEEIQQADSQLIVYRGRI